MHKYFQHYVSWNLQVYCCWYTIKNSFTTKTWILIIYSPRNANGKWGKVSNSEKISGASQENVFAPFPSTTEVDGDNRKTTENGSIQLFQHNPSLHKVRDPKLIKPSMPGWVCPPIPCGVHANTFSLAATVTTSRGVNNIHYQIFLGSQGFHLMLNKLDEAIWGLILLFETRSPSISIVLENAATLFCRKAHEMFSPDR